MYSISSVTCKQKRICWRFAFAICVNWAHAAHLKGPSIAIAIAIAVTVTDAARRRMVFSGGGNVYANCVAIIAATTVLIHWLRLFACISHGMAWHGLASEAGSQLTLTTADDMRQEVPIKGTHTEAQRAVQ